MKKIVILGSSVAAAKAIEEIRQSDQETDISLVSFDGQFPYNRNIFTGLMAQEVSLDEIYYCSREFYEQKRVNVILDQEVTRINFKKNKIFTEDKTQIDYDTLIIADSPETKFPDIKGTKKNGVYGLKKYKDADQIFNTIPLIDTAVIQSDTFLGLQAAMALGKRGKEVLLVTSGHLLASVLDEASGEKISQLCEEQGVRVLVNNTIVEVLGDAGAKAIRLKSGKVLATQMIIFTETREDLRLFSDATMEINNKIPVNASYRTKLENVYAIDHVCAIKEQSGQNDDYPSLSVLEAQGRIVATAIKGEVLTVTPALATSFIKNDGFAMNLIGQAQKGNGVYEIEKYEEARAVYKKIFMKDQCLVGAILVNANQETEKIQRLIEEKHEVNGLEDYILDENYGYDRVLGQKDQPQPPAEGAVPASEGEISPVEASSGDEISQTQGESPLNSQG